MRTPSDNHSRKGQSLVEALIAISVVMMGLMGALSLLSNSVGMSRTVSDNYLATYLASEGIEIVKNNLDHNYILMSKGAMISWNENVCNFAKSAYEVDYRTTDMDVARLAGGYDSFSTIPLMLNTATNIFSYEFDGTEKTNFYRTVKTNCLNSDEIEVKSYVRWKGRGGSDSEVVLEDKFYNWR
jgi:Tfp pilus assembly protein PilV